MKTFHVEIFSTVPNPDGNPDSDMITDVISYDLKSLSILGALDLLQSKLETSGLLQTNLSLELEQL